MPIIDFDYLVKIYLNRINKKIGFDEYVKNDEGYKFDFINHFQNNFDINATNFCNMLDQALPAKNPTGESCNLTASTRYFPKSMLMNFAIINSEKIRTALQHLFDNSVGTEERIDAFRGVIDKMMDEENKKNKEEKHSFIELRFISLLLATMYPNDHYYIMISPYKRLGKIFEIGLNYDSQETDGYNYKQLAYVGDYVKVMIKKYPEVMKVRDGFLNPNNRQPYPKMFDDKNYNWITQDFIFVTAMELAGNNDPVSN